MQLIGILLVLLSIGFFYFKGEDGKKSKVQNFIEEPIGKAHKIKGLSVERNQEMMDRLDAEFEGEN